MAQRFQKAAISMLLSAPSTLHQKWKANDVAGIDAELTRLGFSTAAIAAAKTSMTTLRGDLTLFTQVAAAVKTGIWAGGEPHPDDTEAASIASTLRALDGE